ncbi:MAG: insulinase family protein, partial [Chlamydiia bacterium]|nr:insulinase family protein [Chlamydiia bacterium]
MNWTRLLSSYVVPFTLCAATVVEDTSSLPFLNPDLEKRQVAKLRLANALEVLLVSDPAADLSAASMAVECGSWNDPIEYPGMAHFCEHMLFMGSEKYPDENGFMEKLANFGGMTNAFTADDRTVYMFSSRKEGFLELLDHFSRFYIDPRFDTRCIARELHAVDQEFAKNIQHDGWRIYMISKEMGNPEHPNRMFSIGNSETLSHIPQSALKKWHQQHYGANRMHLAIYSSLPMETLREKLEEYFSDIPTAEQTPHDPELSLLSSRQKGHITYVAPFQNLQSVILRWELPTDLAQDSSQPAQLTAFALARAQKNNLEEELKSAHLIDHISISTDTQGGNAHRFFDIQLMLTDAGLQQIDTVILRCFQALAHLKKEGIPPFLFEEKNALSKL